jgi:peroxin-7
MSHESAVATAPLTFAGNSIRSSPFEAGLLAVASAANFGIVGQGRLQIFHLVEKEDGTLLLDPVVHFETNDGLYDCAWSEQQPNLCVSASGDGILRLHSLTEGPRPVAAHAEHTAEASGVSWNTHDKHFFASCSWDCTIKLWSSERSASLLTLGGHAAAVHEVAGSPHHPSQLLSASADGSSRLWDAKAGPHPIAEVTTGAEILSVDWSKYDRFLFATAATDRLVCVWDMRSLAQPLLILAGHEAAVASARWCPHTPSLLLSASFDTCAALWDTAQPIQPLIRRFAHHRDLLHTAEFSLFQEGLLVSCGWDNTLVAWRLAGQG